MKIQQMSNLNEHPDYLFTKATVFAAEGNRVGLVTCRQCGAVILLDDRDNENWLNKHAEWHAYVEGR